MDNVGAEDSGITRLSFIKTGATMAAGVGAAAIGAKGVADAAAGLEAGTQTVPTAPNPPEPVMAYIRDAQRGEVTVMRGTSETTYRDRALVRRLLKAAPPAERRSNGGGQ